MPHTPKTDTERILALERRVQTLEDKYKTLEEAKKAAENGIKATEKGVYLQEERMKSVRGTVKEIKDEATWTKRTIIGGVIVAILALLFQQPV